jgi:hypothetical protein
VARVGRALNWLFMPWQDQVIDVAREIDPATGELAHGIVVLTLQRQAGKTALSGSNVTHLCVTELDRLCWYTQQDRRHARDTLLKGLVPRIRRSPFKPPFSKIRESNGSESIEYPTGSSYSIFAPADDALHSTANRFVNIDEAWTFDQIRGDEMLQAILPTFATVDGQLWIISAAGNYKSTWFRGLVEAGRLAAEAGATTGMAYFEWGIADDVDPADLAAVAAAHPANGFTLRPAALRTAAGLMNPEEFARAYGNRWTGITVDRIIPAILWSLAADAVTALPGRGRLALALEVDIDGAAAAILGGWRDEAGVGHVEVLDVREGVSWVPARAAELVAGWDPWAFWYDPKGPAVDIGDECRLKGVELHPATIDDVAGAAPKFLRGLADHTVRYRPHPALDDAAAAVGKREVGDRWVFGRRAAGGRVAPIIAASLALWAYDHTPPPRRFKIR